MKLVALFLTIGISLGYAGNSYSQATTLSLELKSKTVREVFKEIEKNSEYIFLYNRETLDPERIVSVNADEETINNILDKLFVGTDNIYKISDRQVYISKEERQQQTVISQSEQQQKKTIHGVINDQNGLSIIGANVIEVGTKNGTITDIDGKFSLSVTNDAVIHVSYIGYISQDIHVSGRESISIILREDTKALDEVVVIGYGETTRGDLTGSVSSIKGNTLVSTGVSSFTEALQGRLAGVHVNMQSGEPGSSVNIQIRGGNSINASTSPLYVIDGMQMDVNESEVATSEVGGYTSYNPLATINPNNIESIEVLKDASATAIYGARGANGVIIITTKSGKSGAARINLDVSFGVSETPKRLKMLEPQDYLDYRFIYAGGDVWGQDINGDGVGDIPLNADDLEVFNWQDLLLRRAATQRYNISLQQATDKTNYNFGLGYDKQEGVVSSNDFTRLSATIKVNSKITDKLNVGMSLNYGRTSTEGAVSSGGGVGSFSGLIQSMYTEKPVNVYIPDENEGVGRYIPLTSMFFDSFKNVTFDNPYGNLFAEYAFIPELKLRVSVSGRATFSKMQEFYGKETRWGSSYDGRASIRDVRTTSFTQSNTLTYNKKVGDGHKLTAMLGQESNGYKNANSYIRVYDFEDESTGVYDIGKGNTIDKPTSNTTKTNRLSYFGRVDYNYDNRYYLTASFRADGSSNFGKGNRFGYFPSGAFAWRISNEEFLKDSKDISNLRLRISYGLTGNDRIPAYSALARLGVYNYAGSDNLLFGMGPSHSPNPDLKWESTAQANVGIDFGLYGERITLTADVYNKITNDLLLNTPIPSQTGFSSQYQNIGSIENKGFEFSVNSVNIDNKNFSWSTTFNFDLNRNKVLSLGDAEFLPVTIGSGHLTDVGRVIVGNPIGTGFGYIADGNYQLDDFIVRDSGGNIVDDPSTITEQRLLRYNYELKEGVTSIAALTVRPGDRKFLDMNGDGVINADDRTVISNSNPDFTMGLSNQFRYKQFDLSFFFEGVFGNEIMNTFPATSEGGATAPRYNLTQDYYFNRWTPTNPSNTYSSLRNYTSNYVSSYYVEDGSFIRFKNLSLGYTFNPNLLERVQVNHLRVSFTVDNLLVWTKYSGLDPDVRSSNPLMPGFDRLSYPRARTYFLGLNIQF